MLLAQASSADLQQCWRPQLHVTGSIAFGYLEGYWVMDTDRAKDSNMQCTVLAKTLELVEQKCKADGKSLPRTLIVACDNTTREGKNTTFLSFLSWLQVTNKFAIVQCEYMRSGHTHNEQDAFLLGQPEDNGHRVECINWCLQVATESLTVFVIWELAFVWSGPTGSACLKQSVCHSYMLMEPERQRGGRDLPERQLLARMQSVMRMPVQESQNTHGWERKFTRDCSKDSETERENNIDRQIYREI